MIVTYGLTIGFIPTDCKEERICCGDEASSGTKELNLSAVEDAEFVRIIETNKDIPVTGEDWWNEKSKFYKALAAEFGAEEFEGKITPKLLAAAWAIFMEEYEGKLKFADVAGEDDCGEFSNPKGKYNGCVYASFQVEEDGEYSGARVILFKK